MAGARKLLLSMLVIGAMGVAVGAATWSAFSSSSQNAGDSFAAGTVSISDNDGGAAMLSLSGGVPGSTVERCILLTYDGSLPSSVRLHGTVSGSLAPYLTLTVTRGTDSAPNFGAGCGSFTADATDYNGNGAGVVYRGPLSAYPSSYATGIVDPKASTPETWTTSESHSYRYAVSVDNDYRARGLSSSATFRWEAQNQ